MHRKSFFFKFKSTFRYAFCFILCASLILLAACHPITKNGVSPSEPEQLNESIPPKETDPETNDTEVLKPSPEVHRGYPASREECYVMAYTGNATLNLNPFAEGGVQFPVDPTGFYQPVYETLFRFNPKKADYQGVLAERYTVKMGSVSITLKPDAIWHDGYALSCQDVIYTINLHLQLQTSLGQELSQCISDIRVLDSLSIDIVLFADIPDGAHRLMEVLTHLLILPHHTWQSVVGEYPTLDVVRALAVVPVNGTGVWSYVGNDAYSMTFSLFRKNDVPEGTPSFLVLLKYAQKELSARALACGDIDFALQGETLEELCEESPLAIQQKDALLSSVYAGERIAGIAINTKSRPWYGNRTFRQLLALLGRAELEHTVYHTKERRYSPACVFALPGTVDQLDQNALEDLLAPFSEEAVEQLMEEAKLTRDQESGKLFFNDEAMTSLSITYPSDDLSVLTLCKNYASICASYGIDIAFNPVSRNVWQERCLSGDYELIFMPSDVDETPLGALERLRSIPSLLEGNSIGQVELNTSLFVEKERAFASTFDQDILPYMEDMTHWLIEEAIFIPLDAGMVEYGVKNGVTHCDFPINTLFSRDVIVGETIVYP